MGDQVQTGGQEEHVSHDVSPSFSPLILPSPRLITLLDKTLKHSTFVPKL